MKKVNGVGDARTISEVELKGDLMGVLDAPLGNDMKNVTLGTDLKGDAESIMMGDLV